MGELIRCPLGIPIWIKIDSQLGKDISRRKK